MWIRLFKTFAIIAAFLLPSVYATAQSLEGLTVGKIFSQAESAANNLIRYGFNRLDMSIVSAGYQARNTIMTARDQFDGAMDEAADTFDGVRKDTLSGTLQLTRVINESGKDRIEQVRMASNEALSTITILLGSGVGGIQIQPAVIKWGDASLDLKLRGPALSQLKVKDLTVNGKPSNFSFDGQDDNSATLEIPLDLNGDPSGIGEVKILFKVDKPRFLGFIRGNLERSFSTVVPVVPAEVESVTAYYTAQKITVVTETRTAQIRQTKKVQTSKVPDLMGGLFSGDVIKRGEWEGPFTYTLSKDEVLVRNSVKSRMVNGLGGCNNSNMTAKLKDENDHEFIITGHIASDRKLGATCFGKLIVTYKVKTHKTSVIDRHISKSLVAFGEEVLFKSSEISGDGIRDLRLAYIEIKSPLFFGGVKKLLPGESTRWAKLEANPTAGVVIVTVDLIN